MKHLFLAFTCIGFLVPNVLVFIESYETGNILLYAQPLATLEGMFANRISSIFMLDLFLTVLFFFAWTYMDNHTYKVKYLWVVWVASMLGGLAGGFPLYLYLREKSKTNKHRKQELV